MSKCFENLISNSGFESVAPLVTSPISIGSGETIAGGWYNTEGTVDLMENHKPHKHSPVNIAQEGTVWLGFHGGKKPSGGGIAEGFATKFTTPVKKDLDYTFTFWAAANKKGWSWPRIEIYLSESALNLSNGNRGNYKKIKKIKIGSSDWTRYTVKFTADKAYSQIMIYHKKQKGYVAIDNLRLSNFIPGCCTNNLIPFGDFEQKGVGYGGWKSIFGQGNFDCWHTNKEETEDEPWSVDVFGSPVKDVHNPGGDNKHWIVLHSFRSFDSKVNGAITTKLTTPMIPNEKYLVSFYGATKSRYIFPLGFHNKAKINMKVSMSSYFSPPEPEQSSGNSTGDWQEVLGGTPIFENFKLHGETKKWHHYETEFVPDKPYQYLIIQAQGGDHPAIDDVCISHLDESKSKVKWLEPFLTIMMDSSNEEKKSR